MTSDLEQYGIKNSERTRCEIWTRVMGYHRPTIMFPCFYNKAVLLAARLFNNFSMTVNANI